MNINQILYSWSELNEHWNRSQPREAAQSMKFLININCLGTYDAE